jgi:hypothetical protein
MVISLELRNAPVPLALPRVDGSLALLDFEEG